MVLIKRTAAALLILLAAFTLSACAPKTPPEEAELAATFTDEFLSELPGRSVEGQAMRFRVDGVELKLRQTSGTEDRDVCVISFSSDGYAGVVETTLCYTLCGREGWVLTGWEFGDCTIWPTMGVPDSKVIECEAFLKAYYPDASLLSRTTDLDAEAPTDIVEFEIPDHSYDIGSTGFQMEEGGYIRAVYTFSYQTSAMSYAWDLNWDTERLEQSWTNWSGDWTAGSSRGNYITITGIKGGGLLEQQMDAVIRYTSRRLLYADPSDSRLMYSETSAVHVSICLAKCQPGTTAVSVLGTEYTHQAEDLDLSSVECLYWGDYFFPTGDGAGPETLRMGRFLITRSGLLIAAKVKWRADPASNRYVSLEAVDRYTPLVW